MKSRVAFTLSWVLLLAGIICLDQSPSRAWWQSVQQIAVSGGGGRTCTDGTHSAAWLARTSGLTNAQKDNYCVMINKMDADSTWALGDAFYIYATNTSTTALLNILSTSFTANVQGSCTFNANSDYTCDGSTGYIETTFVPSSAGGNYTQNSATMLGYNLSSRSTGQMWCTMGVSNVADSNTFSYLAPNFTASGFISAVNTIGGDAAPLETNSQGLWVTTRTGATTTTSYKNGNTTPIASSIDLSVSNPTGSYISSACKFTTVTDFSADKIAAIWLGGGLTSTQMHNLTDAINGFMTTLGINVY